MALGENKLVVEDTPSEVVRLSRLELNKLLTFVELLVATIVDAADFPGLQTDADALDMSEMQKIIARLERPAAP